MAIEEEKIAEICMGSFVDARSETESADASEVKSGDTPKEIEAKMVHLHADIHRIYKTTGPTMVNSQAYRSNYDKIFRKQKPEVSAEEQLQKTFQPKQNYLEN